MPARDLIGMAFVRARVETPVMADESVFDLHDLVEVLRHEAADLVNIKLAKAGGITPALALARRRPPPRPGGLGRLHARGAGRGDRGVRTRRR